MIRGTDMVPHARLTMLAGLVLVFAMLAVLWGLSGEGDPADEEPLSSETPEEGVGGTDTTTSTTTVVTTTASTTTASTTTTSTTASRQRFVNDVRGPVLGDGVDGVLVRIDVRTMQQDVPTMQQIDLATGAIELIDLEHPVPWAGDAQTGVVVNGKLVSSWGRVITITELSDGSQREPRDIADGSFEMRVAGRAGVDSVWLATDPELDEMGAAIEVDLDGEVRRRVEIPRPFSIEWAEGDELILGSTDGSFRYDTLTGATVRMPGAVLAFEPGLVLTASCDESLQCDVLLDRGNGPEIVDWLSASDVFDGLIDLSPDLSGALVHVYGEQDIEYSYVDLGTGSRVDLGQLGIEPGLGVVWVGGSRWIVGQRRIGNDFLAIDIETGAQVEFDWPGGVIRSFLGLIPSN